MKLNKILLLLIVIGLSSCTPRTAVVASEIKAANRVCESNSGVHFIKGASNIFPTTIGCFNGARFTVNEQGEVL